MPQSYIKKILDARVYDVAIESPIDEARLLSKRFANQILLKREDLQPVFSFKLRGAYNKMASLSEAERKLGVVAASAGNHAQGLALSALKLGVKATIVMPRTTPAVKVMQTEAVGGDVVLEGDSFDEAYAHARQLEKERGLTFVHPFDDPNVAAGAGTVALEMLEEKDDFDCLVVPIGGGGLLFFAP